jgi:ubiquinone biosynthesis protein
MHPSDGCRITGIRRGHTTWGAATLRPRAFSEVLPTFKAMENTPGGDNADPMNDLRARERHIAEVLVKQGLTQLSAALGLNGMAPHGRTTGQADAVAPRNLRVAFEELGPAFVKLGQMLSTRGDLLSPRYRTELAKLQDAAPAVPATVVQRTIEQELGPEAFAWLDLHPLASASIGQAHAARLHDGTEVVVKVRRPGAREQIEQDLAILEHRAGQASRHLHMLAPVDWAGLAEEFARILRAELDYELEGRNAERFAANFADDRQVQIPRVYWQTTTADVITLERMRGIKVTDIDALDEAAVDRRALAQLATRAMAKMVFDHGFFHGDPHPGNFFVQPEGRIAIIDFGIVGALDDQLREQLADLLSGIVRENPERVAAALIALGASTDRVDHRALGQDLSTLLRRFSGRGVGEIPLGQAIAGLLEITRRHSLRLPRDLALLAKALIMEEGLAATLDPGFQISQALAPFAERHLLAQLSPTALLRRLERLGLDASGFPGQLHRMLDTLNDGIEMHVRTTDLEPLVARLERLGNRIAVSVLAAAAINSLAELAAADRLRPGAWRKPPMAARAAAVVALGGYAARRRSTARRRARVVGPSPSD